MAQPPEVSPMDEQDAPQLTEHLSEGERMAASVTALALLLFFGWVYIAPPLRTVTIEGCQPSASVSCTAEVNADPGGELAVVLGAGAALLLVAILNRRFSSIKFGDLELTSGEAVEVPEEEPESDEDVEQVDEPDDAAMQALAGQTGRFRNVAAPLGQSVVQWQRLPDWAQRTLTDWSLANPVLKIPVANSIQDVYRPTGSSGDPWYVRVSDGVHERTLRLSKSRGPTSS